jgi:hypothetical protein
MAPGAAPNVLIFFVKGACVAPHDGVTSLANSFGYCLHDKPCPEARHALRIPDRTLAFRRCQNDDLLAVFFTGFFAGLAAAARS